MAEILRLRFRFAERIETSAQDDNVLVACIASDQHDFDSGLLQHAEVGFGNATIGDDFVQN
jgi:hypothetical protein